MSPGYSGRYQSRLLNFVHQQTRRLTEKWDHTFRNIQVATKWGAELLLYPIYRLLHPDASPPQILAGKAEPQLKLSPSTSPDVDTPIQEVLAAVKTLSSQPEPAPLSKLWGFVRSKLLLSSPTQAQPSANIQRHLPVMRGIATNLVNRNLVLVTANNEILDVLTPEQQAKLTARIMAEVGNYGQLPNNQPENKLIGKISDTLAQITGIIPVKLPSLPASTAADLPQKAEKIIDFIDVSLAQWETNTLLPMQQRSQEIMRGVQTQVSSLIYGQKPVSGKGDITVNPDIVETPKFNVSALIAAAIDYFFGVSKNQKINQENQNPKIPNRYRTLTFNDNLQYYDVSTDPWLDFNDLFGNSGDVNNNLVAYDNWGEIPVKVPSRGLQTSPSVQTDNFDVEADFIDVEATFIGYDKHFLEYLLDWIDNLFLWVEELILIIFAFCRGLLGGK